ncbi:MAG: hypothetical protein KME16_23640 [Scytolyngbya sp. HA4215-MV1]|nr:hypothetical protein [Scytolyngbya sp. HA4215-MV1]
MQTKTIAPIATTKNRTKLVSFENSNSWLKRHDDQGTLLIQAGFRTNPSINCHSDDENPIVISGSQKRWYGAIACQGSHVRSFELSKIETARDHFSACLRFSDHQQELSVIAAHWDSTQFSDLQAALLGQYDVIRNGERIQTNVVEVVPVLEGLGTYQLIQPQLKAGATLLIEMGFATAETWVLNESGQLVDGKPLSQLGILQLVKQIADDPTVRNVLSSNNATSINLSLISRALQQDTLGRISGDQWTAIKHKYTTSFLKSFQGYIVAEFESQSQELVNVILTGGGAGLFQVVQPKINSVFTIPTDPQTASVRGSYYHQLAQTGA